MPQPVVRFRPAALVVETDALTRAVIGQTLSGAGFAVDEAADGPHALERMRATAYDIILLEIVLPAFDGLSVCRAMRAAGRNRDTPIVIVSTRHGEADTVLGLESGADDYIAKPFGVRELLARVDAIVRRRRWVGAGTVPAGVVVDRMRRQVRVNGQLIGTTRQEFDLINYLASRPGVPFTRAALLDNVWQGEADVSARTVDALICRLRRKIERNPRRPERLVTAWGVGYMFVDPEILPPLPPPHSSIAAAARH